MSLRTSSDILVIQNPAEEGSLGLQYAYDFLTGHKSLINKSVFLPKVVATTANASNPKIAKYLYKTSA
jgi:ABC-type sugar transport system substrate-binding protein